MDFQIGSEGSLLEGFDGQFGVYLNTTNIIIKRNRLAWVIVQVGSDGSGSVIIQNKITGGGSISIGNSTYTIHLGSSTNILIANNIIFNTAITNKSKYALAGGFDLIIRNNVLSGIQSINGSEIVNNTIVFGGVYANNSIFSNNISYSNSSFLDLGNGNIQNVDMSTVFVDHENYDFHLISGSQAIGSGEFGTDMGIYGGDNPYIDSGFPSLPSILQIKTPISASQEDGMDVQFKVQSNKP